VTVAVAIASFATGRPGPAVDQRATEANITRVTASVLAASQFSHHPLDEQLAGKLLDRYLDALDGSHLLFLQSDVAELGALRTRLASATREAGDARPAHTIFARYLERLEQQAAYDTKLLQGPSFEFTGHDEFMFDREHAPRPRDLAQAHEAWRQALRAEFLQEKLGDKNPSSTEIVKRLTQRHARQLRNMKSLSGEEVLGVYLDSLAHVYDPHSDYLGHEEMDSFSIAMNLSLFGIGASLTNEEGVCTVHELVPGSPAAKSGQLKPGDRIVAVAQNGGEPVDVTDMPLARIVELIRGPKGTVVTLTVLPPVGSAGASRTVKLVRAEIKIEDQQAKARIIDLPQPGGAPMRLGVIDVPSFYAGGGDRGARKVSVTADVSALLDKLRAEKVRGIVLDLRRNGGGSLEEAVRLSGLFIKQGPIVQTRDSKNDIEVDNDPDPGVAYDGPLVVLTSRFSASASEIAAGALQDYGRALIVGDPATFGKGTVQSLLPLAPMLDHASLGYAYDPGGLKVTIAKFYRPSGGSTELRGVASDIVLPSRSQIAPVGEAELKDPLPWDTVPPARYQRENRVAPYLDALRAGSQRRIEADPAFKDLREEIATLKKRLADGRISLNEAERRRELTDTDARDKRIEREARASAAGRAAYAITVETARHPGLPPAEAPAAAGGSAAADAHAAAKRLDGEGPDGLKAEDDIVLNEALAILADYVRLSSTPQAGSSSRARTP
jgi:carboxyl-terminal processing protease